MTHLTLTRDLDLDDQGQGHNSHQKLSNKNKDHQSITYCYKDAHVESLICTKLGQCQGHNLITIQRKTKRFLLLHRPNKFLYIIFILLPIFTLE